MTRALPAIAAIVLVSLGASYGQGGLRIILVNGNPAEQQTRARLERLLQEYDLSKWTFTREVRIDDGARNSHSHPVLTLDTGSANDTQLLSGFIHEQLHWFEELHPEQKELAIADLTAMYPQAPAGPPEGARSQYSTYLHLLVCYLEYEGMKELIGADRAREELSSRTYYRWVYRTVLEEGEKIRAVIEKHGLTL